MHILYMLLGQANNAHVCQGSTFSSPRAEKVEIDLPVKACATAIDTTLLVTAVSLIILY
jgi:hypothetical protein